MIVVYTCILNDFDYLRSPGHVDPHALYVCYSDRPIEPAAPWRIQPAYCPLPYEPVDTSGESVPPPPPNASRCSRIPKLLPHLHFDADYSIWHDANFVLRQKPQDLIDIYLRNADIAMFAHPCRQHVGEEANLCLDQKIGDAEEIIAQKSDWLQMGAPMGLWAGGLIIRRHTPEVQRLNETWWHYFKRGSSRDQLALPMARHDCGIRIETIPGNIYESPIMGFYYHAAWRDKNLEYHTREAEYQMRRKRLEELAR